MTKLRILEIEHINQLVRDTDSALEHYRRIYGVEISQIYRERTGPYNNFLFKMGRMTVEVFSPVDPEHSLGRQHRRFGNCWQACLWRIPDLEQALATCRAHGIPLVDVEITPERRWAFTDPRATLFSIQLDDRDIWDREAVPNDVGILGLRGFTVAVHDISPAVELFQSLVFDAEVLYEEDRPALNAIAVGLRLGGYEMELQSPLGDGALSRFIDRYRQRIRTTTWEVISLGTTARHFEGHGVTLQKGDRSGALAIDPADNLGIEMQFVEA